MSTVLACRQVHRDFDHKDQKVEVLKSVSFEVTEGSFTVLTGKSGSGKTTLLQILSTLDRPTSGEVLLNGTNIHKLGPFKTAKLRASQFGFIFQNYQLLPELTAIENVMLAGRIGGFSGNLKERAEELLNKVDLGHRLTHLPAELSGGEQQRVAVARSLMNYPKVLFADEPTGNLDSVSSSQLLETLKQLCLDGISLIMVTHGDYAQQYASHAYELENGVLMELRKGATV
ncbi:MAG: ABC transporter ATP-binding protein [Lentisphaeria bacterium]|nr:ABC transporter ATP-binding protein [Lentisphaeria bacterium]